jgi:hypothetical protein
MLYPHESLDFVVYYVNPVLTWPNYSILFIIIVYSRGKTIRRKEYFVEYIIFEA